MYVYVNWVQDSRVYIYKADDHGGKKKKKRTLKLGEDDSHSSRTRLYLKFPFIDID